MGANSYSLVAEGLTVRRGGDLLVDGLDWRHAPGRPAWITGPNGVGKSTLLNVLAGFVAPESGSVRRMLDATGTPAGDVATAHYSPSMGLPGEALASSFVSMMSRLVPSPLPLLPDRDIASKRARALSTGEEKRLVLGPILARARPFLFLDEPYEHLSRDARAELTAEIARLAMSSVVVVATNQPIPPEAAGPTLTLSITEAPGVV